MRSTTATTNHNNIHKKTYSAGTSRNTSAAASAAAGIATARVGDSSSGSSSSWSNGSTQQQLLPLSHVLTVPPSETLLVTDAVAVEAALCSDGRFVLYAVAAAALSLSFASTPASSSNNNNNNNNNTRVFWMSCTSVTEECIRQALKKLGCSDICLNDDDRLYIDSLPTRLIQQGVEVESITTDDNDSKNNNNGNDFFHEITFVKELYQRVQAFVVASSPNPTTTSMVILDDVSALSVMVGERLAYSLILSLNDLSKSVTAQDGNNNISSCHPFGLVLRCSNDFDIHNVRNRVALTGRTMEQNDDDEYGDRYVAAADANTMPMMNVPWERALVELADTVVDVTALPSGYSREIAGRLMLTRRRSSAATTTAKAHLYNVCLTDHQVFVLRLAAAT